MCISEKPTLESNINTLKTPSQVSFRNFREKIKIRKVTALAEIADGRRRASSLVPKILKNKAMIQISKGGLVFHKSGMPWNVVTSKFFVLIISNAFMPFLASSHIRIE